MGCKESKHKAVAEGNTIITPSSSRKSMSRDQNASIKNNVPSLPRSRSTRSTNQKQDSLKKIKVGGSKASNALKENVDSGYDKGTVNVSKVLENEDRRLKELNNQIAKNESVTEKESFLIPKLNLPSSSTKAGEGIEAIITDGLSGTSVYYTPTEVSGPFGNNKKIDINDEEKQELIEEKHDTTQEKQDTTEEKQDTTEEKQESVEEIKDTKSAEEAAEDNPINTVDATPVNNEEEAEVAENNSIETVDATPRVNEREAEVAENNSIETVDATPTNNEREAEVAENNSIETVDATPTNNEREAEVAEKIKVAEAAIAALESLVKEAEKTENDDAARENPVRGDKTEDNDAAIQNPVEEAEEIPVTEGEITDAALVIEADKSDIIRETEAKSTEATLQNPVQEADKSEEIPEIEPEATDATLPYPVIESDKAEESLLKVEAEAVENGVKEIHEVADKVEEIPAKEAESTGPTDQNKQELASDKTEDVQEKEAEGAYATSESPVKEVEVADEVKNLVTEAEAVSNHEENPVEKLENMTKDEANTEEDTENSSTANVHQISTEDPDNK